jgi:predicted nucleic acid-binding Zn ribbon protein
MNIPLPPHRHCPVCNEPMGETVQFCSDDCRQQYVTKKKTSNKKTTYIYAIAAIITVVYVLSQLLKF